MKTIQDSSNRLWVAFTVVNFALLAAAVILGFVSFFVSLEIVLTIGAQVIWQSLGDTVQAKYALATLRNVWLLVGGIIFLVIIIYCINHYFKRWREARVHRLYIVLLVLEALIVLAAQAIAA